MSAGQQQGDEEIEISFKVRAWLTLAILSSELLLAFNITMVSRAGLFAACKGNVMVRGGYFESYVGWCGETLVYSRG